MAYYAQQEPAESWYSGLLIGFWSHVVEELLVRVSTFLSFIVVLSCITSMAHALSFAASHGRRIRVMNGYDRVMRRSGAPSGFAIRVVGLLSVFTAADGYLACGQQTTIVQPQAVIPGCEAVVSYLVLAENLTVLARCQVKVRTRLADFHV